MAINVKNEDTVDAVKRLAARLDLSYTKAIEVAVEGALAAPSPSADALRLERVERIAAEYRAHLPAGEALDSEDLYDSVGLYR